MSEILALLQNLAPLLEKTALRRMRQVICGMLVASGRITRLGLSRWTAKGGSYRTLQRFYQSLLPWRTLHWRFIRKRLLKPDDEYLIAGAEVVSKAGTQTSGLDRFFSGLQQQVIPGLAFFTFSRVNSREAQSYPMHTTHMVRSAAEKAACQAKAQPIKTPAEKKKPGRPKGSQNKPQPVVVLNPELVRLPKALHTLLDTVGTVLSLKYVALAGPLGNYPRACMVRPAKLPLISKLRSDAALYPAFAGAYRGRSPKPKYGAKIAVHHWATASLKETSRGGSLRTDIYQGQFYNKEFAFTLNVVIILKTNVVTHAQAHVNLFSPDCAVADTPISHYYSLRFQIEFNFRDAKQFWGLEDFMNVKETAVNNAANRSFFMVNLSYAFTAPYAAYPARLQRAGFESAISWLARCQ